MAYSLSYSDLGSGTGRVNVGSYGVSCAVTDPNYSATPATGTLVIQPAPATLSLSGLGPYTYNGSAKAATCTTSPGGLTTTLTYNEGAQGAEASATPPA